MSHNDHQHHHRHRPHDLFNLQQHQQQQQEHQQEHEQRAHQNGDTEGRHWTSLNCRFDHTLILMNCKSRAEAFARHLQTKLKSLGSRSSVDEDAGAVADGGDATDDAVAVASEGSASQAAVTALSKLPLTTSDSTSAPVMTEESHLIDNRLDRRVHLNSSLVEDELYFDFGYSSPESPVTDVHDNHVDETLTSKLWEPRHECQDNDGLVTEQPHSSSSSTISGFRCVPYAALPLVAAVAEAEAMEGESGCMSAVSSVLTDADDIYTSELDDGDEADLSVMLVLNEDYETAVRNWPGDASATAAVVANGYGSSTDRLTPISEQLTLEDEVETVVSEEVSQLLDSLDISVTLEDDSATVDDDCDSIVPLIMTSSHSPDSIMCTSCSSQLANQEQLLNDASKLHVNVGLQTPTMSPDDVEAGLLSPTPSDESFPRRVQRSSSLKTGKTPPGTPNRKKIVRFADALGLDLEAVKTVFLDDLPTVPLSAYDDLSESVLLTNNNNNNNSAASLLGNSESCFGWPRVLLMPLFEQPGSMPDFLDRVRRQFVCLESAVAIAGLQLVLVVRVLNLDYHKNVTIRYTLNDWLTYDDVPTDYVNGSCDGFSDKFHVTLNANHVMSQQRLLFAVRYSTGRSADAQRVFWDNNGGHNYAFQCTMEPDCHLLSTSTPPPPDESWIHFL